jgi:hypothetical protein
MSSHPNFDMSEYPQTHPIFGQFHNPQNKKVLGKYKDEYSGSVITHVVAIKSKMYGIRSLKADFDEDERKYKMNPDGSWRVIAIESKKAKGIGRTAVENHILLSDYSKVLESHVQTYAPMKTINSVRHRLYTQLLVKKALNALDTKRYCYDPFNTLALGHKDIPIYE